MNTSSESSPARIRLQHPGLIFLDSPEHPNFEKDEKKKPKRRSKKTSTLDEDLSIDWGVTTLFVARRMGITCSAARQYLHRKGVPYNFVKLPLISPKTLIWNRNIIKDILKKYIAHERNVPKDYICTQDALTLLNITTTTLHRIRRLYDVPSILIHDTRDTYKRHHRYYDRKALLEVRKAMKNKNKES